MSDIDASGCTTCTVVHEVHRGAHSGTGVPTLPHGTQVGPGPEKVPLSIRRACFRWTEDRGKGELALVTRELIKIV